MRFPLLKAWVVAGLACIPATAWGQDLIHEATPTTNPIEQPAAEELPELQYPAYFTDLDKAKAQVFAGRYKMALTTLEQVGKGDPAEIALTRASALAALGQREEAIALLSNEPVAAQSRAQVEKARILAELGRLDEGRSLLKTHLEKHPDSLAGHYYLGAISEQAGDLDTALQAYQWIHKTYYGQWTGQGAREFDDAEQVTLMGRAFDRYATLTGAYAGNAPLNNLILKVFVQAYDVIDRAYWPAHVAAAEFYLARSNPQEAGKELAAALQANPNDVRSRQLLCQIALDTFNFDAADKLIATIRNVDATSLVADLLEARSLLQQRRPQDAEAPIQRALTKQPDNLEALGLLASTYSLQLQEDKVQQVLAQVQKLDPDNATAYYELGEHLSGMRQYPRAEKMYEVAIDRAPWWMAPRNGLGLLMTQSGNEDKAKVVLEAAYALDPFNFRTTNYLILLDKLAKMARKESEHFVVLYDARQDPLIAEYFSDYLESIHQAVCKDFRHEPAEKTLIEVFPSHDAFSVRTTGSPWIGTVGASTGRVIALVAPRRGKNTMGPYNWAQVLRHEYTHTVTLSATDNRIAHWMTEGLAVYQEHAPLQWEWVPMLYNAVKKKQLFSMDDLMWAFVRPRKPQDRSMAYAQSFWTCQFIAEKWGHDTILKMMELFKAGKTQEQVFQETLKLSTADFSTQFTAWAEQQVQTWGYDPETTQKYNELVEKAEAMIQSRQYAEAISAWEQIVQLRPMDQLPHQRLAGLYLAKEVRNPQKAAEHLLRLHQTSTKDNRFAKRLARLYIDDLNDPRQAERLGIESVYIDPYDLDAHELLAGIYEKTGNTAGLERERRVIPLLVEWKKQNSGTSLQENAPQR